MSQSDGTTKLSRFYISDKGNGTSYSFTLNPQKYKITFPQRVSALKTMDRVIIEDFNGDIPTIQITGHTGFRGGQGEKKMRALRTLLDTYANGTSRYGASPKEPLEFYNFTDGDYYYVTLSPEGYSITRDVDNPLIHNYEMNFYVLGQIGVDDIQLSEDYIGDVEVSTSDKNVVSPEESNTSSKEDGRATTDSNGKVTESVVVKPKTEKLIGTDVEIVSGSGYGNGILRKTQSGSIRLKDILGVK